MDIKKLQALVVDALEDIKGFDIAVMDVRKLTNMTNYMIVASATSSRQAKAMVGAPEQVSQRKLVP